MKNIVKEIFLGLKRKDSNFNESVRLNLPYAKYMEIKKILRKELTSLKKLSDADDAFFQKIADKILNQECKSVETNLEKNYSKISVITTEEPKSPDDIIRILGIDTTQWKLSQYWNIQKGGKWNISALVTKVTPVEQQESNFLQALSKIELKPLVLEKPELNKTTTEKVCAVISLQDIHFGKTGNENIAETVKTALQYLVIKAYKNYVLEKIVLVVGADTLNMDTFAGTTTKFTPVENSETPTDTYIKAFNCLVSSVAFIKAFCKELNVIFIPGNHDRLSSFHLLHAVSLAFKGDSSISFDIDYKERKVITYGWNMLAFEHGDKIAKNNPLLFATEFPTQWGATSHRYLYTGHYHGRKVKEVITESEEHGFLSRTVAALTSSDYWHYHNKWTGNKRAASIHIHESKKGFIAEFNYTVE